MLINATHTHYINKERREKHHSFPVTEYFLHRSRDKLVHLFS